MVYKLNNKKQLVIFFFAFMLMQGATISCQTIKTITNMSSIEFIPKEFNDVKLGYYETGDNVCTPSNADVLWNKIVINVPNKIICYISDSTFMPIIPICGAYIIGEKRSYKYHHLWANMLHIRKKGDNMWYSGEIVAPNLEYEHPKPYPGEEEAKKKTVAEVEKAQNYSDEEVDRREGQGAGGVFNINLVDYVEFPFETGTYEIFMSTCGLESNKATIEIIFKE
jgi:hypothetical protein